MKEKEPIVTSQDYGKDEDSSEALLKKHEALVSDLEAFGNTILGLREQATGCRVSLHSPLSYNALSVLVSVKILCPYFHSNKKHL